MWPVQKLCNQSVVFTWPHRFPAVGLDEFLFSSTGCISVHLSYLNRSTAKLCVKCKELGVLWFALIGVAITKRRKKKGLWAPKGNWGGPPLCEQQGFSAFSIQQAVFPSGVADPAWHAPCCGRHCQLPSVLPSKLCVLSAFPNNIWFCCQRRVCVLVSRVEMLAAFVSPPWLRDITLVSKWAAHNQKAGH